MTSSSPIPVILLTGFLGAGKTTLLNRLLTSGETENAGVLVNEFGETGVDAALIREESGTEGAKVYEITGGSIFCSCLKAGFLLGLKYFSRKKPSILFIEASGMSDPSGFNTILDQAGLKDSFKIAASVCMIDPVKTPKLIHVLPAVKRQITEASLVLISKGDITNKEEMEKARQMVTQIAPEVSVKTCINGDISINQILEAPSLRNMILEEESCNTPSTRPGDLFFTTDGITRSHLDRFIRESADDLYRLKGFMRDADKSYKVDDGPEGAVITGWDFPVPEPAGITLVCKAGAQEKLKQLWEQITQS